MGLAEQSRQEIADMIEDLPVTFTWDGSSYIGTPSGRRTETNLVGEGGFLRGETYSLLIGLHKRVTRYPVDTYVSTFANDTTPNIGSIFIIDNERWRVIGKSKDHYKEAIVYDLENENL